MKTFTYQAYDRMVRRKLLEIVPKKLLSFAASSDPLRRRYFWERLGYWPQEVRSASGGAGQGPLVWVHANAIGEVLACRGFLHDLKLAYPEARYLLTTMNFDGYVMAKRIPEADAVAFLPYDHPACVRRALDRARPRVLIVLESDWWPNLLEAAADRNLPVIGVSMAFRSERPFYDRSFPSDRAFFGHFSCLAAQSEEDLERFAPLASPACHLDVTGNIKADRRFFRLAPADLEDWRRRLQLAEGETIIVAGSLREPEEEMVIETFVQLGADLDGLCLIVAPRYLEQVSGIVAKAKAQGLSARRVSRLKDSPRGGASVLVLDTYGELNQVYAVGAVAIVGGSLVPMGELVGGQNPLEPATHGVPVVFGRHMDHFRHLADLFLARGAAREVQRPEELAEALREILLHTEVRRRMTQAAEKLLDEQAAVTTRSLAVIKPFLDSALGDGVVA